MKYCYETLPYNILLDLSQNVSDSDLIIKLVDIVVVCIPILNLNNNFPNTITKKIIILMLCLNIIIYDSLYC
jgi:hypothetical protein